MHYFYILRCSGNSLYCGQTTSIGRRIKEHNEDPKKSARYTWGRRPVRLVYFEEYKTLSDVLKRELEVKSWTKKKKELLVESWKAGKK
ncbi:endonuclease [Candidatus Roizmanbacteria bacterium CG_4_9_14_0_2_um_filter_39_13]|uniref:Endonuclease n=2 Tax=Candidatus Roizmaniibacteriota TaxID=1752723 RepID=A0A2M8EZT8_9BACT|nr:MAG: endonuclease [Candidatus Roizmanbacteria bacterium CG_4_10_14_0_2_um_filter_39_12]PJC32520.1 MAG: endonuclease [Candidatus Roizmanbacteria bacterium CG_4_9_14_0_2_um_filter_39_13]PJE61907.1 MAG: endonuclease [Candidatus Roizmanbacteria bacterium CG10_big_fil_rev_8_21_14_0_10_39_12]